jgi:hypothetical protein
MDYDVMCFNLYIYIGFYLIITKTHKIIIKLFWFEPFCELKIYLKIIMFCKQFVYNFNTNNKYDNE